jgi:hypothetical protein
MDEKEITTILTDNGGKLWEKNGMRRVYFASSMFFGGLKHGDKTSSGNTISKAEEKRMYEQTRFFFDFSDNQFHAVGLDEVWSQLRDMANAKLNELQKTIV